MRTATLTTALAAFLLLQSTTASVYPRQRPRVERFLTEEPCDELATATAIAVPTPSPQPVGQEGANAVPADINQKHNGQDHNHDGNNGNENDDTQGNSGQGNNNDNAGTEEPEDVTVIVTRTRANDQPTQPAEERVFTQLSFITTTVFAAGEAPTVTVTPLAEVITQVQVVTVTVRENTGAPPAVTVTETFAQPARTVTATESAGCAVDTAAPEATTPQKNNVAEGFSSIAASEAFPSEVASPTISGAPPVISSSTGPATGSIAEDGKCNCQCLCGGEAFSYTLAPDSTTAAEVATSEIVISTEAAASTNQAAETTTTPTTDATPTGSFLVDSKLIDTPVISSIPFASAFPDAPAPAETAAPSEPLTSSIPPSSIPSTLNLSGTTTASEAAASLTPEDILLDSTTSPAPAIPEATLSGDEGEVFTTDSLAESGIVGDIPAASAFSDLPTPVANQAGAVVTQAPVVADGGLTGRVQGGVVGKLGDENGLPEAKWFDINTYGLSSALVLGNLVG